LTWETGQSLLEYGLRRANELSVEQNDDFVGDLKDYLNLAYWDIIGEFPWLWAMKYPPYQLTTVVPITVSGVASAGSPTVTLSADPGSVVGRKFIMEADGVPLRIVGQTGASLMLATAYPVDNSGGIGMIYKDEYAIPGDIAIAVLLKSLRTGAEVEPTTNDVFDVSYGRNMMSGSPKNYTYLSDGIIQLGRWPASVEILELRYVYIPPAMDFSGAVATDTPIIPLHIRWIVVDRALFYLLTDMEDPKATLMVSNSSARLAQEKDRMAAKWRPRFWIPSQFRIGRSRM
jgi:hypothetical protein